LAHLLLLSGMLAQPALASLHASPGEAILDAVSHKSDIETAVAGANFEARKVTLNVTNGVLKSVLKSIEKQSGYTFVYRNAVLDDKTRVSIQCTDKPVANVLTQLFGPLGISYALNGNTISLTKKSASTSAQQQPGRQRVVKGVVTDNNGEPIIGANVIQEGGKGTITDAEGAFTLTADASKPLTVSYIGYKKKNINIGNSASLKVRLEEDAQVMDEVVVIGYGSKTRRDITSAIGSYKPGDVNVRQALGVDDMLQGRVAGVNITSASGVPGSKNRVSIRGIGSITAGNEPLYVIDGVPINNTSGDTGAWSAQSMNGLDDFNPADIESVQVLKDAASAAIYGSRATNGVILITTKKGSKGAAKVNISTNVSFSKLARTDKLDVADTELFLEVLNEAIDNYNLQTNSTVARIDNPAPGKAQTDWLGLVLRTAVSSNVAASINGGGEKSTYYLSANYNHNEGVIINNLLKRYNLKFNLDSEVKKWLKVGTTVSLGYSRNNRVPTGYSIGTSIITRAIEQRPWDSPYRPDGSYAKGGDDLANHNPIQAINEEDVYIDSYRALGSLYLQLNLTKDLNFKSTLGEDFSYKEEHIYYTNEHPYGNSVGKLIDGRKSYASTIWENVLNYNHGFASGLALDVMAGYSIQKDVNSNASQTGIGFPSSFDVNSVAAEYTDVSTGLSSFLLQSYFGRVGFNYSNRYLLSGTMRADGSSKFRSGNRYGYFPSVSAGWNLGEEPWWSLPKTDAKVRVSWGNTGNQAGIGSYAYQSLAGGGFNYNGVNGLGLSSAGNPDLKWEKSEQTDVGVDLSFFGGALTFSADAFIKDTKDLLYSKPTPATSGYTTQVCNIGAMRNRGLEFSLGGNLMRGDFSWHSDINISFIRNKLTSLLDDNEILTTDSMHALKVGKPVGAFYMIKFLGIYQSDDEVPESFYKEGVRAGDCIYEDVNGDGKIDADDKQFVGSANPNFSGGFNNTFKYKGFDLSVFFTFSQGNKLYELWTGGLRMGNGTWPILKSAAESRWTGPGTTNETPRAIYGYTWNSTKYVNTRNLHDASYIRLRTASVGYTFPKRWMRKIGVDNLRLYVQGENLFVLTRWPYLDPEVNVSLDATNMGYDYLYPSQPRTFSIGASLKF
jgi:TonB-linked SusC/RagA family outer membrane protein